MDPRAARGFAGAPAEYERGRPAYPPAAVERLVDELRLGESSVVLDLAAGTGKLTRPLVPHVARVIAVEPSEPMRDVLRAVVPGVEALPGTAEEIPLGDEAVDAVCVGEAFHWFQTVEASREIARVLRPGGWLALLWNKPRWSDEDHPWMPAFTRATQPLRDAFGPMPIDTERWQEIIDGLGLFESLSHAEMDHVHVLDADGLVAMIASWTWVVAQPDDERAVLLEHVRSLLRPRGEIRLPFRTDLYWTRRRG